MTNRSSGCARRVFTTVEAISPLTANKPTDRVRRGATAVAKIGTDVCFRVTRQVEIGSVGHSAVGQRSSKPIDSIRSDPGAVDSQRLELRKRRQLVDVVITDRRK